MGSIRRKELQSGKVSWEARVILKGHPSLSKSFSSQVHSPASSSVRSMSTMCCSMSQER